MRPMSFCVTGVLSQSRDDTHDMIEAAGGEVHKSVRKGTTYLVVGEKVGATKIQKAEDLGIQIIDEQELMDLLNS